MKASAGVQRPNFTALVRAADGVRFSASSQCPDHLTAQIVTYILARCDDVLWPDVAAQVRDFIADDNSYAAIALYFTQVGERWDEERLELSGLSFDVPRSSEKQFAS